MEDLHFEVPATDEVDVDPDALAGIDRGIQDADAGRTVSLDDARKMIPEWISKYESRNRR